jgi:hypothetical protein
MQAALKPAQTTATDVQVESAALSARARKTRLKTIRLSESLARSLEKEATEEGTTVNADVNSILGQHFDWDKKAREFGYISLHKPIFMRLIEELDDETLARIGREDVIASWKEQAEFFLQDSTPNRILEAMGIGSKSHPGTVARILQREGECTITLRHDFGPKWSVVAKNALQEFVREMFHVEPRISAGESVVTAHFKVDPENLFT